MKSKKLLRWAFPTLLALVVGLFVYQSAMAANTFSGNISSAVSVTYTGTQDLGTASWSSGSAGIKTITLTDGSTANKANKIHVDTIATGTSYDLDAGTLVNPLGVAQAAFSRIVSIRVCAPSTNTAAVTVGGDFIQSKYLVVGGLVDDPITVDIPVAPGGCFLFTAPDATGVAVTASTGDVVTVTPSGSETAYVVIVGS